MRGGGDISRLAAPIEHVALLMALRASVPPASSTRRHHADAVHHLADERRALDRTVDGATDPPEQRVVDVVVHTGEDRHASTEAKLEGTDPVTQRLGKRLAALYRRRAWWLDSLEVVDAVALLLRPANNLPLQHLIRPVFSAATRPPTPLAA